MLPEKYAKPVVEYLRATRHVYELCMARHVAPDFHRQFDEFRRTFLVLNSLISLPWTLKCHVILGIYIINILFLINWFILDHFEEYFKLTGVTFRYTTGEFIESMHHRLRMMMEKHNLHITSKSLGTKLLETKLLKTICLWNFLNLDRQIGNKPVPRSVEAIAGAVYSQQF